MWEERHYCDTIFIFFLVFRFMVLTIPVLIWSRERIHGTVAFVWSVLRHKPAI